MINVNSKFPFAQIEEKSIDHNSDKNFRVSNLQFTINKNIN